MELSKYLNSIMISIVFSFTSFFFGPINVYLTNLKESSLSFNQVIIYLFALASFFSIILFVFQVLFNSKFFSLTILLLTVLLFVQSNFLVFNIGLFDGNLFNISNYYIVIDIFLWGIIIVIYFKNYSKIEKNINFFIIFLLLFNMLSFFIFYFENSPIPISKEYMLNESSKYLFSEQENIIVIVLDSFQTDIFSEIITEKKYKDLFDGFIYYPDSISGFQSTVQSVPIILTGEYYNHNISEANFLRQAYLNENSLPYKLNKEGYNTYIILPKGIITYAEDKISNNYIKKKVFNSVDFNELIMLYDLTLFKYSPHFLKQMVTKKGEWTLTGFTKEHYFKNSMLFSTNNTKYFKTKQPVFKYIHLYGPHAPFFYNESLEFINLDGSRESYEKQAKGSLNAVNLIFKKLKENELYNNSLIFLIADHGSIYSLESYSNVSGIYSPFNIGIPNLGIPLFLIKPFNSSGELITSNCSVSLKDVSSFILHNLSSFKKKSFGCLSNDVRRFYFYDYSQDRVWGDLEWANMTEYEVNGFSWYKDSWHKTGRIFTKEGIIYLNKTYQLGTKVNFGLNGNSEKYQEFGWSFKEKSFTWTESFRTSLYFPLNNINYNLILSAEIFPLNVQEVNVLVNEQYLGKWFVNKENIYHLIIPKELLNNSITLTFELPNATSPKSLGINDDERKLAIAFKSLVLYPSYNLKDLSLFQISPFSPSKFI